jgi:hypothetical protein
LEEHLDWVIECNAIRQTLAQLLVPERQPAEQLSCSPFCGFPIAFADYPLRDVVDSQM